MFNFLKRFFSRFQQKKYDTGTAPDTRPPEKKEQDYLHEEIAIATVPVYKDGKKDLKSYPIEDQKQTLSCVAHGCTLAMTKGNPRLSKMFFYRMRANYPSEGMWLQNAGDIAKNYGSCFYWTLPNVDAENMANNIVISDFQKTEAAKNKVEKYLQFKNPNDIDAIATVVSQGDPVAILIYGSYREWSQMYPALLDTVDFDTAPVRHCVTAVDAFKENGVKYLKIQDSAPFGGLRERYVSEDFIKARCYGGLYFTKLEPANFPKPDYIFTHDLYLYMQSEEIKTLQKRLQYEGAFPATTTPTGYFGGITLKAVKDYQARFGIPPTGFVGPMTRGRLNE